MPIKLVVLGPPGAGKGTQAERFARGRGIPKISTGDILRDAVQAGNDLGRGAKAVMEAGRLVSDEIMIGMVSERLERNDAARGFVLDGFPRTVGQAKALDAMAGASSLIVLDIEVPEDTLVARLSARRVCGRCGWIAIAEAKACAKCGGVLVQRSDDGTKVVRERLRVYGTETRPLVEFYEHRPTFRSVDGDQTPDAVASDIAAAVAAVSGAYS
jgi:adenylate kinase